MAEYRGAEVSCFELCLQYFLLELPVDVNVPDSYLKRILNFRLVKGPHYKVHDLITLTPLVLTQIHYIHILKPNQNCLGGLVVECFFPIQEILCFTYYGYR